MSVQSLELERISVGIVTPQGMGGMVHKADNFTKITMIPGQLCVVQKTSRDGTGTITVIEIFAGAVPFWEYELKKTKAEEILDAPKKTTLIV